MIDSYRMKKSKLYSDNEKYSEQLEEASRVTKKSLNGRYKNKFKDKAEKTRK